VSISLTIDEIATALRSVDAYPWRPETVEAIETHISWVFLAGDKALKLKKPVNYSFVDYSTLELRKTACEDEVRLNRRLTTDIYLGVAAITVSNGRIEVDGEGEPVEWATLMHRLPAHGMLDYLLQHSSVAPGVVDGIADRLIRFHRESAEPCGDQNGSPDIQLQVVRDNLHDLAPFAGSPLPRLQFELVTRSLEAFLDSAKNFFERRVREGWIREGHGDLRTDHICQDDREEIQIFDCVEFSKDIRCADIASDLAFLLVDLDRLGAPEIAQELVSAYRAAALDVPEPLLRFYRGHRALVKVKVACLSWRDLPAEHRREFLEEATTYLDLATAATTTKNPFMLAMTGLSGTGKSVVSASLARALGVAIVSTDVVRKELKISNNEQAGWQQGKYEPAKRFEVYQEMIKRAQAIVSDGEPVILDASFLKVERRQEVALAAKAAGVPLVFVETISDDEVARNRLRDRTARADSPSEATVEIYDQQRAELFSSPPGVPAEAFLIQVDTTPEGPVNLDVVYAELQRAGVLRPSIDLE
jgi:aminoglycoside phosphotransferase family enzyme/predicted kinase